jgi:ParG
MVVAMVGRPATGKQKQLGVSVNEEQRVALEAAAAEAGHSVAEEIRQRLDRTLYEDAAFDEPTRALAEDVRRLAHEVAAQAGALTLPRVHDALAEAIKTWLQLTKPQPANIGAVSDMLASSDPPTLGRTIAHTLHRARSAADMTAAGRRRLKQGNKPEDKP